MLQAILPWYNAYRLLVQSLKRQSAAAGICRRFVLSLLAVLVQNYKH